MKGIIFTEFNEMVETQFSPEMLDDIIVESNVASEGAYTSVGTYEHTELVQLVTKLSEKTDMPVDELVYAFGEHLAARFSQQFTSFFDESKSAFDFMKRLDNHIHVEVKRLYPDAKTPSFSFDDSDPKCLIMEYQSYRGFADVAHGLIVGVIKYYQENIDVRLESIDGKHHVRFYLHVL